MASACARACCTVHVGKRPIHVRSTRPLNLRIRKNVFTPTGVTRTEMVAHRFEDEAFKRINVETTPYPRLADPEDTAAVIAFLCSPGAEMINGQSIVVDGGWTKTKYLSPRVTNTDWVERK